MNKTYSWFSLAMVAFTAVFGFSNIPLNYGEIGLAFVPLILFITLFFFLPLVLMMAEMAVYNKDKSGGLYSWVETSMGKGWAFVVGWSFFIANIFYLPMVAGRVPVYVSYALYNENIFQDNKFVSASLAIGVLLAVTILVLYGPKLLEKLADSAGPIQLMIVIAFIALLFLSPMFIDYKPLTNITNIKNYQFDFTPSFYGSFAWLLFAVAGAETIGPLIKNTHNPLKNFVKAMFIGAIAIGAFYALGTVAVAMVVPQSALLGLDSADAFMVTFEAFFKLFNLPSFFIVLIAILYGFITLVALLAWSSANVQTLFSEIKDGSFPNTFTRLNKNGMARNGLWVQFVLCVILVLLQTGFIKAGESLYFLMYDMSTMALILPYIVLVIAYMLYRIKGIKSEYQMVKSNTLAIIIAAIVLFLNAFALLFGAYDPTLSISSQASKLFLYYGGLGLFLLIGLTIRAISRQFTKPTLNK